jgi:hypothetical protein
MNMWFAYMDETGNTGRNLDDPSQPLHLILTLAAEESKVSIIHEHIRDTARQYCPGDCEKDDFEFHGKDLYAAEGYFTQMPPDRRIEIFDAVLKGIEKAEAEIVIRGVNKPDLSSRYARPFHPHDIALMFTIESIERLARERECRVLLVADEAKEIEDAALRDLAQYQEVGTSWGWKTEQIERIVDTIHFVPSHSNPAIQLVDCATYVAMRKRKIQAGLVSKSRSDKAIEELWERHIEPFVREDSIWYPQPRIYT